MSEKDAITGLRASARRSSLQIRSLAEALPPGLLTLSTMAFTLSSSAASRTASTKDFALTI